MNLVLPLAVLGTLGGLYVYKKKKHAAGGATAAMAAHSAQVVNASWQTSLSVTDVQHALNELGASPALQEDGVAGPKTVAAIKSFQSQMGLSADGIVGPQTTAALDHAVSTHGVVAGGSFGSAGDFFFNDRLTDLDALADDVCNEPDPNYVGAGWGAGWSAPDVGEIMRDPQQQMQIGLNELWKRKAEAAFGPGTAAGYDYSFLPDQGQGAQELASEELGMFGGDLAGVNLVSGPGDDWSAPDIGEAMSDPVQQAELATLHGYPHYYPHFSPYDFGHPMYEGEWGEPQYYVPAPGNYPFGPYGYGGPAAAPQAQMAAQSQAMQGGVELVNQQGYEFQSQPGRKF